MWNQAGLKVKPCCVLMKIHLRQSFAGTCLSQLVCAESFEGDASDFGKCFTPILRLRILRRVISKKHCKLDLRGGETRSDEVVNILEKSFVVIKIGLNMFEACWIAPGNLGSAPWLWRSPFQDGTLNPYIALM